MDHQDGFQCNKSTIDQIFCIHQTLKKKQEQLGQYIWCSQVSKISMTYSNYGELLHKILNEFGIAIKLIQLIQMYLNRTNNKVAGFEVLTAAVMKSTIFWDIMSFSLLKVNRHFRGTYLSPPSSGSNKLSKIPV
jgi:hypothetical protein